MRWSRSTSPDGSVRWRLGIPVSPGSKHALLAHGQTVFVQDGPQVWAVDAASGEVRWSQELPGDPVDAGYTDPAAGPVVADQ